MRDLQRLSLAVLALATTACAASPDAAPRIGNKTFVTPDGLERVKHEQRGSLFLKPDHGFSSDHQYVLNQVLVTYEPDSPRFSSDEEARMRAYVERGLAASLRANGWEMVSERGPCVLSIGLGLIDIVLREPSATSSSTNQLEMWGAVTMVLDVRGSESGEPLLRYGRRVAIPGGVQYVDSHPQWQKVQQTLDALLESQHLTLQEIVAATPEVDPACGAVPAGNRASEDARNAVAF